MHSKAQKANRKIMTFWNQLCHHQHDLTWLSKCYLIPERAASSTWSEEELSIINAKFSTFIHTQQTQNHQWSSNWQKTQSACGTHACQHPRSKHEDHDFLQSTVSATTWFNLAQQVLFDSGTSSITNMIGRGSSQSSTPNCPHSSTLNKHKMTSDQVVDKKLRTPVVHMQSEAQQANRKIMTFCNQLCQHQHDLTWLSKCYLIPERAASSTWSEEGALNHQRQILHIQKIAQNSNVVQLIQGSDKCDTSLAVESALCTTGSPRRWSQRVSRKCCESVGAAKDVIMPLAYQLDKAKPSKSKINNARSYNFGSMVHCF